MKQMLKVNKIQHDKLKYVKLGNNSGITLVALVITIIILLLLAGITLNLTLGENGLLSRTETGVNSYKQGELNDINLMDSSIAYTNKFFNGQGEILPQYTGKLTEEERDALNNNNIKELKEINLKNNEHIKGVITGEVPIPTGLYYKEGIKDTGVVITDGTSEFVWVPVPDIDEMAVLQSNSTIDYQGVLYDFSGTTVIKRVLETIGSDDINPNYREPDIAQNYDDANSLSKVNNILGTEYSTNNEIARSQFKKDLQNDFNSMVESVKKYNCSRVSLYIK